MPQQRWIAAIPAIADQQHNRSATKGTASPAKVKFLDRVADACSASPIPNMLAYQVDRFVDVFVFQQPGDAREPRAKDKCFDAVQAGADGMDELDQNAAVAVHRAADVAQH